MNDYEANVRAAQFKVDEAVRELNAAVNGDALPDDVMAFVGGWVVLVDERLYSPDGVFLDADITAIGSLDQPVWTREAIIRRAQNVMTPVAYVEVESDEDDD